jgi:hypothetical protein
MIRDLVERAAYAVQLLAALAILVLCGRFAFAAVGFAIERQVQPPPSVERTAAEPALPGRLRSLYDLLPSALAPEPSAAQKRDAGAAPTSVKAYLVVSGGPERSDVYVNGVRVGQSPFVGDVTCKPGKPVRIELLPPKGAPLVHERPCIEGTLRIE